MGTESNDAMNIENMGKKDPGVLEEDTAEELKAIKPARTETEYAPISYFSLYRYDYVLI
jgi:hypothetical protein